MILKKELIDRIKSHFGLNIYETKVWLALLSKGVASAGEIAEISGVPRSRTYDVLESLEKQGFAMQKIGKPVKYLAVKPTNVIEKLKKNVLTKTQEKIGVLSKIKNTSEYKELESLHSSKTELIKNQDISTTVKGRLNINSQISDLMSMASKRVIICSSTEEIKKRIKFLEPIVQNLKKIGIKLIVALNGEDREIKEISEIFGVEVKKVNLNASFYIADKTEILFMLNKSEEAQEQMAVWFSSPFFVQSFTSLFEMALRNR